jgi:hypothetical protein
MLDLHRCSPSTLDRRDQSSRSELVERVYGEFNEMPCLRLTAAQAQRLFALRADICDRILTGLVVDRWLALEGERYRFNDARSWPPGPLGASAVAH